MNVLTNFSMSKNNNKFQFPNMYLIGESGKNRTFKSTKKLVPLKRVIKINDQKENKKIGPVGIN